MPQAQRAITINRPVEAVFAYLADGEKCREWRPGVLDIQRTSGDGGVGTTYRQGVSGPMGRRIAADYEITKSELNRLLEFQTTTGPVRPHGRYDLETIDGGTRLSFALDAELSGTAQPPPRVDGPEDDGLRGGDPRRAQAKPRGLSAASDSRRFRGVLLSTRLSGCARVLLDSHPEIYGGAFIQQTHRQRLAPPVLDRPLAPSGSIRMTLETLVLLVGGELRAMDRQLLLGEMQPCLGGGQIGEEELEEPKIAQLRGRAGRPIEPLAQGGDAGRRDREDASTSASVLAGLGDQTQVRQSRRLAVQEGVWE